MKIISALIKREILESKNSFILTPIILAGVALCLVVLTMFGFGEMQIFDGVEEQGVLTFSDAIDRLQVHRPEDWPAAVMVGYLAMIMPVWIVLPFVIFFGLLGTLYEERRDRSILFWKSMPVSDWQEVLVKLAVPVFIVPCIFLAVAAVTQIAIGVLLSVILAVQGGDVSALWPVGLMLEVWISSVGANFLFAFWALPLAAWVLFVSSFASRMPFMWVVLPPVLLIVIESMFLDSHGFGRWFGMHAGGWMTEVMDSYHTEIDGPRDLLLALTGGPALKMILPTLTSMQFWTGLVIAAGFVYGAVQMRKRAL